MPQNPYLLPTIGAGTTENEQNLAENLPKFGNYLSGPLPINASQRSERAIYGPNAVAHVLTNYCWKFSNKYARNQKSEQDPFKHSVRPNITRNHQHLPDTSVDHHFFQHRKVSNDFNLPHFYHEECVHASRNPLYVRFSFRDKIYS